MVFFPSYAYMSRMVDELYELEDVLQVQDSRMNEAQREAFLAGFRDNADGKHTRIGMCVMGGIFSEGIDLKGDSLIGVIVVGTGLPQISRERDLLRQYFDEHGLDGFSYAYLYPGMNKVLQSAGRLIRTDEDCGVIVLLDERFMRWDYRQLFPREWADIRQTSLLNVGEDVQGFWEETACLF
jgi:Rad3-related DNA helicase